jgi:NADH-quinone oxidoreductase subunit C
VTTSAAPTASARPARGRRAADTLARELPDSILRVEEAYGEVTVYLHVDHLVRALQLLRDHTDTLYQLPLFVSAVDWPDREPVAPRFDVVYQLRSLHHNDDCRLIVQVPEAAPQVPTSERVFAGMDWHERETFDLFGIEFVGHHDLHRILMPEDWVGHPLRKDYVSFGEPVAFTHNLEWALPAAERPRDMPGELR